MQDVGQDRARSPSTISPNPPASHPMITAPNTADVEQAGSSLTRLGVYAHNTAALRPYENLGSHRTGATFHTHVDEETWEVIEMARPKVIRRGTNLSLRLERSW